MSAPNLAGPTSADLAEPADLADLAELVDLVRSGQAARLADWLAPLDEERRRMLGAEFTTFARSYEPQWHRSANPFLTVMIAAVGLLPSAAQVAALVCRPNLSWQRIFTSDPALVVRVAHERGIGWLGDLALRLATRIDRQFAAHQWRLVADLLRAEEVPPPTHDRFVGGWLSHLTSRHHDANRPGGVPPLVDELRDDPLLDALVLPAFDHDAIASAGWDDGWSNDPICLVAVAALAQEGRLARGPLLDGCLAALTAGRRPGVVRAFALFHERLTPSVEDIAERCGLYTRLVTDAPGNVARMAQQALRRLDDAGGLGLDRVLGMSCGVLIREEKGLVKAQLSWLGQLARRHPDRRVEIAEVVATALAHPAVDLVDRARSLLGRLGAASAALTVHEPTPPTVDLLPEPTPTPMPAPIGDVDELAEEVALLDREPWQTVSVERVLAGVALLRATEPKALRQALRPVVCRLRQRLIRYDFGPSHPPSVPLLLNTVLRSAVHSASERAAAERLFHLRVADANQGQRGGVLHAILALRLAERSLRGHYTGPELASTPTLANGLIAPEALVERLARAERDGHEIGPWDLALALYRLPTVIPEDTVDQARRLASRSAASFVTWAEECPPAPVTTVVPVPRKTLTPGQRFYQPKYDRAPKRRLHARLSGAGGGRDPQGLFELAVPAHAACWYYDNPGALPLTLGVLPAHRDVMAAHLLPYLCSGADLGDRGPGGLLPMLAEASGPAGPATRAALACGLGARHDPDRVAAVDALLMLAAHGPATFDPTAFGEDLGRMVADRILTLSRLLTPLRDAAQSAPVTVWRIVSAALPAALATNPAPRGLPDLLTIATQTAPGVGVTIPGLAEIAGRSGSSRLIVEARRLAARLAAKP